MSESESLRKAATTRFYDIWEDFSLGTSIAGVRFLSLTVSLRQRFVHT